MADPPDLIELEKYLAQVEQNLVEIKLDNKIVNLLDDLNEIEKDTKASLQYHDKITL